MFNNYSKQRKENSSPLRREHSLHLEVLEERALLSAMPWTNEATDTAPAIFAPTTVPAQESAIIPQVVLEGPQELQSDPGTITNGIYTFNGVSYDAHDVACLQAFFEQTDDEGITNGVKLNATYDVNDPETWHNATNDRGAFFEEDDSGVMRLTGLQLSGQGMIGVLDVSGCTSLKSLDCGSNNLTSLDVSGCTSLKSLDCQANNLTSLDVSGCTSLKSLDCGWNNLTSLDVSGCTELFRLDCQSNNLTSLEVSGCTALKDLDCGSNNLTSLDVSGCTELFRLGCQSNNLTSLEVSGRTSLMHLYCQNNNLTSLNVSGCTKLTTLFCYNNNLTSLDVSGLTSLIKLHYQNNNLTLLDISDCTELVSLWCSNNNLTSLDVSGCTKLKQLACGDNNLTLLDISGLTSLEQMYCENNNLTSLEISGCTELLRLDCQSNNLTSLKILGCTKLNMLHCQNNNLTKLDVSECLNLTWLYCWNPNLNGIIINPDISPVNGNPFGLYLDDSQDTWTFQDTNGYSRTIYNEPFNYIPNSSVVLPIMATNADGTQKIVITNETSPLAAPTLSEPTIQMSKVSFTWDAVPAASGYQFEYKAVGSEEWITKTINGTSASFAGVLGTEYTARVKTIGKYLFADSEYSNEQKVPQLEIVATINARKVTVSWLDNNQAADTIQYRMAGTTKWTTKKLKAGLTTFTFNGKAGVNYEVQVLRNQQARDILQGTVVVLDQAKLKVDKNAIKDDTFQVNVTNYMLKNLASESTQAIVTLTNGKETQTTVVDIENNQGTAALPYGGKVTFENGLFTFSKMTSNTSYKVQVSFTDDVSVSTPSSKLSVKTTKAPYLAPEITSATAISDTEIRVTWKNTYGKKTDITAQKYTVQYSLDGYKWSKATTGATGNSYTIQKLKGGNMYQVRVLATKDNMFNASEPSTTLTAETLATPKAVVVKNSVTSNSFQIQVSNYANTNLVNAMILNVKSDKYGEREIVVKNGICSAVFENGMTVEFQNGTLTFENAPSNTQQKIQLQFTDSFFRSCTTAWSSAVSVKTAKAVIN